MHLGRIEAEGITGVRIDRRSKRSRIQAISTFALAAMSLGSIAGCGNTYRPVVTSINPVGPAAQPQRFAVVISNPGPTLPGLVTIVDFSGDSVLITASIGVSPYFLMLNAAGTTGYTLNGDGTMTSLDISTTVQTRDVVQTTLLANATPNSIFSDTTSLFITEPGRTAVAQLTETPPPPSLNQEFPIDPGYTPVWIAGYSGSPRAYVVSQNNTPGARGEVAAIEIASSTISTKIDVGINPVYGVMTSDGRRAFIMNHGDNTVTVINAQTNQLDVVPTPAVNPIPVGNSPLWADLAPTRNELVVANEGDGTSKGSVSIINIPLCSTAALPGNPNCDPNNPIDANGFGQVLATVPVGVDPQMVAVLQDGSRAYVINKADSTVSVVNLTSNTVTATIPVPATPHPTFLALINGTPTGKVYVTSPESDQMTIIRTDTDIVETTVPLQGKGIMVRAQLP
ncbi:YncE family protein [Edaphobacter modestus]|uniref:YVTN family beta-propeller protein n=1 Tax=Edaphobacter modestus TaxID=388466 RepID=A0A4Q7YSB4_9BACT|nr:YncE family protein [Edaphobacter modestus]RZU39823.1 YVTN family beta-propeller protein [Edaphobacter modestus]